MKKPNLAILSLIFVIICLSIVRVVVSNSISTSGIALDRLEQDIYEYKTENIILKEKLLSITSLDYIASKASSLGFVESKQSISLNKSLPLAIKR